MAASNAGNPISGWFPPASTKISIPREFSQKLISKTQRDVESIAAKVVKKGHGREYVGIKLSAAFGLGSGVIGAQKLSVLFLHLEKAGFSEQFHEKFISDYERNPTLPEPTFEVVYRLVYEHREDPVWTAAEYPADASVYDEWTVDHHYAKLILAVVGQARHADVLPIIVQGTDHPAARETPTIGREIAGAVEGNLTPWISCVSLDSNIWSLYHALLYLQAESEAKRARK